MDLFAGTGIIGAQACNYFSSVIFNDHLFSNEVIYKAFFGPGRTRKKQLDEFAAWANSDSETLNEPNYFGENFGNRYFDINTATRIGNIREHLETQNDYLSKKEKAVLLASLLYSCDRVARTVGHYETFLKSERTFSRSTFHFSFIQFKSVPKVKIFREDANTLARTIKSDVTYIDPPYNSRQYSRFYHVLETLTKWDQPPLQGIALKPPTENSSEYCKSRAPIIFDDLIRNLDTKLIVVSYNNTYNSKSTSSRNKIQLKDIESIVSRRGPTNIVELEHKFFNAGKTDFKNHKEMLFVTEVTSVE